MCLANPSFIAATPLKQILLLKHVEQIIQIITVQLTDCVNLALYAVLMLMSTTIQMSDGWYETSVAGLYNIQLGHAELGFSGSKQYALEHQFILYHGFVHEFGKSYGVQILDIVDCQYSYYIGMYVNSNGSCGFKLLLRRNNHVCRGMER